MIGSDSDTVINRWSEIVAFVAGFKETPDLATFLNNNYLAKAGGTMTGPLKWKDNNTLPQQTSPQYFLCIDAFDNGGTTKWASKSDTLKELTGLTSTAIGDSDEPVYWNGSKFVKAGAYPTKSSWNYDDRYLKLAGGTMSNTNVVTNLNADLLDGLHAASFYQLKPIRSDQNSIYDLRFNYGTYDKGDFNGTYKDEYPTYYGSYIALTTRDKNIGALMFFDTPTSNNLGHIYISTRGAGDSNTTYSEWGTLAYITDNVASSSKWANARTITLTGSVTGSVSLDGSANVSLATTTNHTHTFDSLTSKPTTIAGYGITDAYTASTIDNKLSIYLPLAGGQMNNTAFIAWNKGSDGNDLADWSITDNGLRIISSVSSTSKAPVQYATGLHVKGRYGFQIASQGGSTSNEFYIKNVHNTTWNTLLHSNNYTTYTVKKDGTGASGTWGISITGSAGSVAWNNVTGKPETATRWPSWSEVTNKPNYASSDSEGGAAKWLKGSYTYNGGKQMPNYFGKNKIGALMMNTTINGNSQYKDFFIMDCYHGDDAGGAVALGVNRQSLGAYIMRSAAERISWEESAELLGTHNYTSYTVKKDGTGATGTWSINISGNADTVDGKHANNFVQRIKGTGSVVHYLNSFLNWNGIQITIPLTWSPQQGGMFAFTIRLYHEYKYTDIVISGYNYGNNHWHLPAAEIIGGTNANYKVKFGWFDTDDNKKLWVWIGRSNNIVFSYGGLSIMNVHCGFYGANMYEGWESANVSESELTNIQHSINTLYLPVKSNGNITGNAATATNVAWSGVTNKPNFVNSFGTKTGDITIRGGQTSNGSVNLVMSNNELQASIVGLGSNAYTSTAYLPLAGGTMNGLLTTTFGNNHSGIKVGNTYINAINGELIFQNNNSIRFGGDSWNYNVWAGLKYVHSSKIVYLGLADGSVFAANSAQSGGKLYLPGIDNLYTGNGTNLVWHAGNDGSGSGLDADLLDGKHASAFATSDHNHDSTYVAIAGNQIIAGNKTFSGTTSLSIAEIDSLTTGNLVNQGSASLGTITSGIWNASTIAADYLPLGGTDSGTKRWVKKDATTGQLYIDQRNDIQTLPTGNKAYLTYIGAQSSSNNNKSNAATTNGNTYMKIFEDNILKNQYKISGSGSVSVASDANGNITITGTTYTNNVSTPDEAIAFAAANYNLSSASWTSATSLTSYSGTFAIQIKDTNSTTNKTNYYSGIIMLNGSTGRQAVEEIPLSALMATGSDTEVPTRIYAGIQQGVLKLSSQDASAVAHNITVKILKLIAL